MSAQDRDPNREWRSQVAQAYDSCSQAYLASKQPDTNASYLEDLLARLAPASRTLDLGCGAGYPVALRLAGAGHKVIGIDISEKQLQLARQRLAKASLLRMDLAAMGFAPRSFDAVVSFYAIFHVPRVHHRQILESIHGILVRGGYLLATLGTNPWQGEELFHGALMRWSHYGAETYLGLLSDIGYELVYHSIDRSDDEEHLVVLARRSALGARPSSIL